MSNYKRSIQDATDSTDDPIWLSNKKPKKIRARASPKAAQQSAPSTAQILIPLSSSSELSDNTSGTSLPILVYNLDQSTSHDRTRSTAYELNLEPPIQDSDLPVPVNQEDQTLWIDEVELQSFDPVPDSKNTSGVAKTTKIRKRRVRKVCCSTSGAQID